jgi:hypothetical protein
MHKTGMSATMSWRLLSTLQAVKAQAECTQSLVMAILSVPPFMCCETISQYAFLFRDTHS